ncbi:hypothetical protein BJ875DRAFT_503887 [Amylocarpus encephaloides]|uniref:Uncharacterized protein n=1 Tax=Amylocarpus encephaloides TaxID=45428 RepID=A0A9P7YL89_9HELO|nr:hypothetical protein BJ875DRAFT_503887 [Amylocarpus encephaloides]
MRLSQTPTSLLSFLLVALSNFETAQAFPVGEFDFASLLLGRTTCVSYCGADNQFCCTQGQSCTTLSGNVATCLAENGPGAMAAATGQGGYAVYTTTYTETDLVLRTSTYSSFWQAATSEAAPVVPATTAVAICSTAIGETSCGPICCAGNQGCAAANSCTARGTSWIYVPTASGSYSPPLRPTSGGVSTATGTISATTTQPFLPPATASGSTLPISSSSSSGGLSAGAIAGIVIGTIAGVILLLLICFCCIVKAGFDGFLTLFGLGKNRRRRTSEVQVIEERYSRHGSGAGSSRRQHTGWFGGAGRPTRVTEERKKKSSGFGGFGAIGAGLLGLAVILGLKRKSDHKEKPSTSSRRSDMSGSSYTYDSYTGSSPSKSQSSTKTFVPIH